MLSETELGLVREEMRRRVGAAAPRDLAVAIDARLIALQRRENADSVGELLARARADQRLWGPIVEALTPHETRFFGDRAMFRALRLELLPALLRMRGAIRVWSAGCSSGQEAYSLAMLLETLRQEGLGESEIVATDLSQRLLEKARSGLYTQFEVQRGLPIRTLITQFEKTGELWRISDRLRAQVRFEQANLLDAPDALGRFDLIVCSKVMPALDPDARRAVLEHLAGALNAGGVLLTGADGVMESAGDAFTPLGDTIGCYSLNEGWRRAA